MVSDCRCTAEQEKLELKNCSASPNMHKKQCPRLRFDLLDFSPKSQNLEEDERTSSTSTGSCRSASPTKSFDDSTTCRSDRWHPLSHRENRALDLDPLVVDLGPSSQKEKSPLSSFYDVGPGGSARTYRWDSPRSRRMNSFLLDGSDWNTNDDAYYTSDDKRHHSMMMFRDNVASPKENQESVHLLASTSSEEEAPKGISSSSGTPKHSSPLSLPRQPVAKIAMSLRFFTKANKPSFLEEEPEEYEGSSSLLDDWHITNANRQLAFDVESFQSRFILEEADPLWALQADEELIVQKPPSPRMCLANRIADSTSSACNASSGRNDTTMEDFDILSPCDDDIFEGCDDIAFPEDDILKISPPPEKPKTISTSAPIKLNVSRPPLTTSSNKRSHAHHVLPSRLIRRKRKISGRKKFRPSDDFQSELTTIIETTWEDDEAHPLHHQTSGDLDMPRNTEVRISHVLSLGRQPDRDCDRVEV